MKNIGRSGIRPRLRVNHLPMSYRVTPAWCYISNCIIFVSLKSWYSIFHFNHTFFIVWYRMYAQLTHIHNYKVLLSSGFVSNYHQLSSSDKKNQSCRTGTEKPYVGWLAGMSVVTVPQQTRDIHPRLVQCWPNDADIEKLIMLVLNVESFSSSSNA